jgi:hypothetical protein
MTPTTELERTLPLSGVDEELTGIPVRTKSVAHDAAPDPNKVCHDGERTHELTRLVGMWIAQKRPLDDVKLLALGWNVNNLPPLTPEKVISTCASIWQTHLRNHGAQSTQADALITPLFDLESARVSRFFSKKAPPRRYVLNDCLPLGIVGTIVGTGGTSKSQLAMQIGVSVATGLPALDTWTVGEPGGVLILMAEDDEDEIHRRTEHILNCRALCEAKSL